METNSVSKLLLLFFTIFFLGSKLIQCSVTYDRKAILINGQRRILISGSIHYPRSTPEVLFFSLKKNDYFLKRLFFKCFYLKCIDVGGSDSES
jgi:hypothetical protein